jgi:hypothetical protein
MTPRSRRRFVEKWPVELQQRGCLESAHDLAEFTAQLEAAEDGLALYWVTWGRLLSLPAGDDSRLGRSFNANGRTAAGAYFDEWKRAKIMLENWPSRNGLNVCSERSRQLEADARRYCEPRRNR